MEDRTLDQGFSNAAVSSASAYDYFLEHKKVWKVVFEGKNRLGQDFDSAAVAEHLEYGLQELEVDALRISESAAVPSLICHTICTEGELEL